MRTMNNNTNDDLIVKAIRKFVSASPIGADLPQIEAIFKTFNFQYEGDMAFFASHNSMVLIWFGWNNKAIDLLEKALDDDNYTTVPCQPFLYTLQGYNLPFPIIDKGLKHHYREIHWVPSRIVDKRIVRDI